jgi:hypothetical protein
MKKFLPAGFYGKYDRHNFLPPAKMIWYKECGVRDSGVDDGIWVPVEKPASVALLPSNPRHVPADFHP